MFAVIKTGGKQYRVAANDTITIASLAGEAGEAVTFGEVLLFADGAGATQVGAPTCLASASPARSCATAATRRSSPSRSAAGRTRAASAVTGRTTRSCASPAFRPDARQTLGA